MAASADHLLAAGPNPKEVYLTVGLSVLLHGVFVVLIVLTPRFQIGTYISVPVSYQVDLVSAAPGGRSGGAASRPPTPAPAPAPAPAKAPAPAAPPVRSAPPPPPASRPSEELTLPGRQPARKAPAASEPSLRPPSIRGRETSPVAPERPLAPVPQAPAPAAPAERPTTAVASPSGEGASGRTAGVEVAGPAGSGSGGTTLAYYLTLVDRKIQDNWVPIGGRSEAMVVIRFRVLPSGQVRDVELETSSGDAGLDASALRAIRQSLPLPPFPNLLTEPYLNLRYRFVMERG